MEKISLPNNVWILVCDGRKALLLQNTGDHVYPKLEKREAFDHPDEPTHDLGSDVPGRVVSGKGGRRSSIEPTDLHRLAEGAFMKKVAEHLESKVGKGEIKKLILVAPARALGDIRPHLSPAVHAVIQNEIDKDYVRMPIYEIERHLSRS